MKKNWLLMIAVLFVINATAQKFKDLALTPPMGWNSWNTFQTKISEKLVMETADSMASSGMKDAGYGYIVLDDGWMAMERDKMGNLVPDPAKFPNGMKAVADYVHSKGLKFGLYNCAGTKTCAGYPGTRGYEYQDARLYASLEIDYLKFDWCSTEGINAKEAYTTMSKALRVAGRPIIFSLCEWGDNKPWQWAEEVGHLWRTTGDIGNCFICTKNKDASWNPLGVVEIVDKQKDLRKYAGPGHWNDPDMLEVGNGMSQNEDRTHFSLWCMMAAPLIAGNDLRKMSKQTISILTDKEVIAIDQDSLGMQGYIQSQQDSVDTWIKPLLHDEIAVCFFNRSKKPVNINYNWKMNAINDTLSKMAVDFNSTSYEIRNIWANKAAGSTDKIFTSVVPSQDVVMLRLTKSGAGKIKKSKK
ncbi:MAG: glycoside hydrolase family 27 protein [Ferruginibacter sp.]